MRYIVHAEQELQHDNRGVPANCLPRDCEGQLSLWLKALIHLCTGTQPYSYTVIY